MVAPSFWGWGSQRQKPGVASTLGKGSVAQLGGWETEALSQLRSKPLFPPGTHTHSGHKWALGVPDHRNLHILTFLHWLVLTPHSESQTRQKSDTQTVEKRPAGPRQNQTASRGPQVLDSPLGSPCKSREESLYSRRSVMQCHALGGRVGTFRVTLKRAAWVSTSALLMPQRAGLDPETGHGRGRVTG